MKYANLSLPRLAISAGLLMASVCTLPVRAETIDCTAITSLPYVIATQGVYCFTGNMSTSMTAGNAITINTNNVVIDLNGYKLGGQAAGSGTETNGIYAGQRKNITLRNGTIRGFYRGVFLDDTNPYTTSQGHVVTGILADQSTFIGINLLGRGMTLRRNTVVDTGGSTVWPNASGIAVSGPGNNVLDNQVSTTMSVDNGFAWGILLENADYSMLMNNRVSEIVAPGSGNSNGISINNSNDVTARDNTITFADYGLRYQHSTGKYMENLTNNISITAFTGGTAIGINN